MPRLAHLPGSTTMNRSAWILLFLAGCGGGVGSSDGSGPRPASGAHVYFLNFDGQALTSGADDPAANRSSLLGTSVTLPAYIAGDVARATKIQAIVSEVDAILAPYDVAVVTTRPASGSYDMLVAG